MRSPSISSTRCVFCDGMLFIIVFLTVWSDIEGLSLSTTDFSATPTSTARPPIPITVSTTTSKPTSTSFVSSSSVLTASFSQAPDLSKIIRTGSSSVDGRQARRNMYVSSTSNTGSDHSDSGSHDSSLVGLMAVNTVILLIFLSLIIVAGVYVWRRWGGIPDIPQFQWKYQRAREQFATNRAFQHIEQRRDETPMPPPQWEVDNTVTVHEEESNTYDAVGHPDPGNFYCSVSGETSHAETSTTTNHAASNPEESEEERETNEPSDDVELQIRSEDSEHVEDQEQTDDQTYENW